jgi:hypothetical protein
MDGEYVVKCFHAASCEWNTPTTLTEEQFEALGVEAEPYVPAVARPIPRELIPPDDDTRTYYRYKDSESQVVLVTLRIDKGPGNKVIFPMHYDGERLQPGMPAGLFLFGRETLLRHPNAPVLVVEGEKTVKAAYASLMSKGKEMAVVSWPLGCSNILKGDWNALKGREVILWPDNDEAGIKAMNKIKEILEHG